MKPEDEVYPLGDDDIELLAGYQREGAMLQGRMAGVLDSFIRRHKLQGRWELSPNGREIRRPIQETDNERIPEMDVSRG